LKRHHHARSPGLRPRFSQASPLRPH